MKEKLEALAAQWEADAERLWETAMRSEERGAMPEQEAALDEASIYCKNHARKLREIIEEAK